MHTNVKICTWILKAREYMRSIKLYDNGILPNF